MPLPIVPPGLEAKANQILADVAANLVAVQPGYLATHRRYWQGIRSHAITPKDGAKAAPDKKRKPTDQAEDWTAANIALPASMEIAVTVNVYQTPRNGWGYEVMGEIEIGGRLWRRCVNIGPEKYRAADWRDATPGVV